jgi:hypothetical protein
MKPYNCLLIACLLCTATSFAQPVWSPKVRATREAKWMQDSLHLTPDQLQMANPILLNYQEQMDKNSGNDKKQHDLMKKKDSALKAILDKGQFKKYYRREEQIRALPKPNHSGPHQPY